MTIEEYQQILEKTYVKNLEQFKNFVPKLYKKLLKEENPEYQLELNFTDLNISKNGKLIYPYENTMEYFDNLLLSYYKKDKQNLLTFETTLIEEDNSIEQFGIETKNLNYNTQMTQNYKKLFNKLPNLSQLNPYHDERYSMIVFGIGLGYHIPKLINKYQISHLVLVDDDIEMLRASLYVLDWKEIFEYFTEKDKQRYLEIMIEKKPEQIEKNLFLLLSDTCPLSLYNMAQLITYDNSFFKQVVHLLMKNISVYTGANHGFYDDEKWSLQHTIHNLNSNIPVLSQNGILVDENKHVFIIGNGPSLDTYIEYIRKNQDKVIVIAAGSAISSLYKADIRVDIIIQIERTFDTYDLLIESAPKEYYQDKILIGMNTLHPRTFDLFKKKYMFFKSNDTGAEFMNNPYFPTLAYTNPTVANGAFRIVLQLGFRNISFFGLDFGFKTMKKHHSKFSNYSKNQTVCKYDIENKEILKVRGTITEFVYTDYIYNNSRKNIEKLTEFVLKEKEEYKIYNYSEGAFINNTILVDKNSKILDSIEELKNEEREKILNCICNRFKVNNKQLLDLNYDKVDKKIEFLKSFILMFKRDDINAYMFLKFSGFIYSTFSNVFLEYKYIHRMTRGTLLTLLSKTYIYVAFQKQDNLTSKFINMSIDLIISYLNDVQLDIKKIDKYIDRPF